jgi:hypothetical protein
MHDENLYVVVVHLDVAHRFSRLPYWCRIKVRFVYTVSTSSKTRLRPGFALSLDSV